MVRNQRVNEFLNRLMDDPKVKIYATDRVNGFKLAQDMLNASAIEDPNLWSDEWASKWSEAEKRNAVFLLIGNQQRVNEKIGVKLLVVGPRTNF
jgi:general stress protein 26